MQEVSNTTFLIRYLRITFDVVAAGDHSPNGLGRHDQCKPKLESVSHENWLKFRLDRIVWRGNMTPYDNDVATNWFSAFL